MATIVTPGQLQLIVVVALVMSAAAVFQVVDAILAGVASMLAWFVAAFGAFNLGEVTRCCIQRYPSRAMGLLFGGLGIVMLIYTLRPTIVTLNPFNEPQRTRQGGD